MPKRHQINHIHANIIIETLIWLDALKEWDNFITLIQLTSVCRKLYALRHKITMPATNSQKILLLIKNKLEKHPVLNMRRLAGREIDRRFNTKQYETMMLSNFRKKLDKDEADYYNAREAGIVFGVKIPYNKLRGYLMIGRRWWCISATIYDSSGNKIKSRFDDHKHQFLDELPYPLIKKEYEDSSDLRAPIKDKDYVEIRNFKDFKKALDGDFFLHYDLTHLYDIYKSTLPKYLQDSFVIEYTGYCDSAGYNVVIGFPIMKHIPFKHFDTEVTGHNFFRKTDMNHHGLTYHKPVTYDPIEELHVNFIADILKLPYHSSLLTLITSQYHALWKDLMQFFPIDTQNQLTKRETNFYAIRWEGM